MRQSYELQKVGFTVYHLVLLCGQREYRQGKQQYERDSFELIHILFDFSGLDITTDGDTRARVARHVSPSGMFFLPP